MNVPERALPERWMRTYVFETREGESVRDVLDRLCTEIGQKPCSRILAAEIADREAPQLRVSRAVMTRTEFMAAVFSLSIREWMAEEYR